MTLWYGNFWRRISGFPPCDDGRCGAMAEHVDAGPDRVNERVQTQEDCQAFQGEIEGVEEPGEDYEIGARNTGDSLGRELQCGQYEELLSDRKMKSGSLRHKASAHRKVNGASTCVEGEAERSDYAVDALGDAQTREGGESLG